MLKQMNIAPRDINIVRCCDSALSKSRGENIVKLVEAQCRSSSLLTCAHLHFPLHCFYEVFAVKV